MLSQDEINKLLDEAKPSIIDGLKRDVLSQVSWDTKNVTGQLVQTHVAEWVKENVLPEITKELVESRQGLIQLAAQLAPEMVRTLVESMAAQLKKNLETSYVRSEILKKMFGS